MTEAMWDSRAQAGPPRARVDWVSDRLRDLILLGELAPGERIRTVQLAKDWDVSPTPIREAIQRLASEGLLDVQAQQGARVARMSPERALEIFELSAMLEPFLVRLSVEQYTDEDRTRLKSAFDAYERVWAGQTIVTSEMSRCYLRYFETLAGGGDFPTLRSTVRNLKLQRLRYNTWIVPSERIEIHRRAASAALNGDAAEAMRAVSEGIRPGVLWARRQAEALAQPSASTVLTPSSISALREITAAYENDVPRG